MRFKKRPEAAEFVEMPPEGVVVVNMQSKIVTSNARANRIFGYTSGELDDKRISFLVPQRLRRSFSAKLGKQETVGERRDLSEFPAKFILSRISLDGEKFTVCTIHDLSAQRKVEARVAEKKQAHEDLVSLSKFPFENPNPVFRLNRAGQVLFANKAAKKLLKKRRSKSGAPSLTEIRFVAENSQDAAMVKAMISMAGDFGIKVIAERVESQEQVSFLREQNCEALQGFLFSQPLPVAEFTCMLAAKGQVSKAA